MTGITLNIITSILSHYNCVLCEVEILSMSKHMMNCVFDCANECNVIIYYQDTDPIHLNYDDVDKLGERYKDKHKLDLVGENLVQFHVDFPTKMGIKRCILLKACF